MSSNPTWSILLIEASYDLQSLIQMSLSFSVDSSIQIAHSVAEAFELLQTALPDIIFLGIENLGLESLQELNAQPITQTIPIVALTNRARLSQQLQIQQYGAKAILPYAFDAAHLQAILQEITRIEDRSERGSK